MLSAFEVAVELDEMIQAGLTIRPSDLTPGEVAVLLGFNRGRNRSENEAMEKKASSAQTQQEKQRSRERYRGGD